MIQYKLQSRTGRIERMFDMSYIEAARVWVCTACGAKVFHCRAVSRPQYQCLCGEERWSRSIRGVR